MMYTMNLYSTCIEIIRSISGSMGVIFTVPVAAAASAFLYGTESKKTMYGAVEKYTDTIKQVKESR